MEQRVQIFNTYVDNLSMDETIEKVEDIIKKGKPTQHVVLNASKINLMRDNSELTDIVNSCELINADGASILWAAKKQGHVLKERVTGIDLFQNLLNVAEKKQYKIFLFGAKESVVRDVKKIIENEHPKIQIVGYRNGYFDNDESRTIAKDIAKTQANIVFVAFTSPMKEYWISENLNTMNVPFVMGVGGSFDVIAGVTNRAPVWMQKVGLEWFYRFIQEPKRMWKRYLVGNSKFIWYTLKESRRR